MLDPLNWKSGDQEEQIRRIMAQGQPKQKGCETPTSTNGRP
jgi:hypothetical protein